MSWNTEHAMRAAAESTSTHGNLTPGQDWYEYRSIMPLKCLIPIYTCLTILNAGDGSSGPNGSGPARYYVKVNLSAHPLYLQWAVPFQTVCAQVCIPS